MKISSAEYFIDGYSPQEGGGTMMSADDGIFDELNEVVQGNINASQLSDGTHTVFVRASDAGGNWSAIMYSSFTVFTKPYIKAMYLSSATVNPHESITVKIQFSKSMNTISVSYSIPPQAGYSLGSGVWSKTVYDNDTWTGTITDAPEEGGKYELSVWATDTSGDALDSDRNPIFDLC